MSDEFELSKSEASRLFLQMRDLNQTLAVVRGDLTSAVDGLRREVDVELDKYVLKEVFTSENARIEGKVDTIASAVNTQNQGRDRIKLAIFVEALVIVGGVFLLFLQAQGVFK